MRPPPSSATPRARSPPPASPEPSPSTTPPRSSPCAARRCANSPATAAWPVSSSPGPGPRTRRGHTRPRRRRRQRPALRRRLRRPAALDTLLAACEADGVRARRVPVDYASHSPQVERLRDRILQVLDGLRPRASAVPLYSTVTGELLDTTTMDAAYWYESLRRPVRFDQTVGLLLDLGHDLFTETSPHPVLTAGIQDRIEENGARAATAATLRRDEGGADRSSPPWPTPGPAAPTSTGPTSSPRCAATPSGDPAPCPPTPSSGSATGGGPRPPPRHRRRGGGFWDAVDRGDLTALADLLGVDTADGARSATCCPP
ncbi:acyltransferase domain-containing protein [Streptomyces sp. M19]